MLALLLLVMAVYAYTLYQSAQAAQQSKEELDTKTGVATQNLINYRQNNDRASLQEELEQVQAEPEPKFLPAYEDALALDTLVTTYSDDLDLPLTGFERVDTVQTIGDSEFPAVSYLIVVRGDEEGLTGMLSLLNRFPTALLRTVEFNRPVVDEEDEQATVPAWEMKLELDIIYR